jgi:hypothetical protein
VLWLKVESQPAGYGFKQTYHRTLSPPPPPSAKGWKNATTPCETSTPICQIVWAQPVLLHLQLRHTACVKLAFVIGAKDLTVR